jgi:hypothetical protein
MLYITSMWMLDYCGKVYIPFRKTFLGISMDVGQGEISGGTCMSIDHQRNVGQNS